MNLKKFWNINKREIKNLLLLLIMSLPSVLTFLHPGFPQTDDGNWMIIRLSAFYEALRDGQFPVRWIGRLNNGYGYPVANFLYPGFMYLGFPIAVLTSSFVVTTKILFATFLMSSSVGMFLWLRKHFNVFPSLIGSCVYLYAPYHLYDVTVRGSLGEVMALGIIPLVLWAIDRKSLCLLALCLGLLLISHNTLAILFLPVILLYQFVYLPAKARMRFWNWAGIALGIGLSSFFWLPALGDLSATVFSKTSVSDWQHHFATFSLIGFAHVIILGGAVLWYILTLQKKDTQKTLAILFFMIGIVAIFLSSSLSSFVWEILPSKFVQFPFRFLSLSVIATAFLATWMLNAQKKPIIIGCALLLLSIITAVPYVFAKDYQFYDESYYATNVATTTVKNEYMPKWVKEVPSQLPDRKVEAVGATISDVRAKSHFITFRIEAKNATSVTINQVFFPGWNVTVNGVPTPVHPTPHSGLIRFSVPKGEHYVVARLSETPLRLVADGMSLFSLVFVLYCGIQSLRRKR